MGSDDDGKVTGVDIGRNTIERFANLITTHTDPSLAPESSRKTNTSVAQVSG